MIKRELYLSKLRPFYDSSLIKVLYGVRRSGKSEILKQIKDELIEKGISANHIIYINFENLDNFPYLNAISLHTHISEKIIDKNTYYLLFDEIQLVNDFERVINSLKASKNVSLFVTGSNASLLSGELATLLTGRYISIKIMPFVFNEMVELKKLSNPAMDINVLFNDYLKWGGMPQRYEMDNEQSLTNYLEDLLTSIIYKDILMDEKKANKRLILKIINYLFENTGKIFSDNKVYNALTNTTVDLRKNSVYDIIHRILDAMLVSKCPRYDIQGKNVMTLYEKYYVVDLGLRTALHLNDFPNYGANIETILYNEFIARGYQVYVGKTYKGEVDFLIINGNKRVYVQACYKLSESNQTREREFNAFSTIADSYKKYVLSTDSEDYSYNGIEHLNIIDYLLHKVDLDL